MTKNKKFLAVVAAIAAMFLLAAQPASAFGVFYGNWGGSSVGYVYWGETCGLPNNQANLNFGGGPRGGSTYVYDVRVVNGSDRILKFTNRIRFYGSNGGPIVDRTVPDLAPHTSHRLIVDTTFSGTRLTSVFYPYVGSSSPDTDCGQTFTQIDL